MAGLDSPALAGAVSRAGGMGSLGLAGCTAEAVGRRVAEARAAGADRLNLNFLLEDDPVADTRAWGRAVAVLSGAFVAEGIDPPDMPPAVGLTDAAAIRAAIAERPAVMSFHFNLPEPQVMAEIRAAGIPVIASATDVAEALALEDAGCDAIIAQGWEAGGHRGIRKAGPLVEGKGETGTMALVPAIVDAVSVPVIAAGGIGDARGVAAAVMLGAQGVQMGTAFLRCPEAATDAAYRAALEAAGPGDTSVTRGFSGRPARALRNRVTDAYALRDADAMAFPMQFAVIGPLRATGRAAYAPYWAGQSVGLGTDEPAGDLVTRIARDAEALLSGAGGLGKPGGLG